MNTISKFQFALLLAIIISLATFNTIAFASWTLTQAIVMLIATLYASGVMVYYLCRDLLYYWLTRISVRKVITRGSDNTPYLIRYTIFKRRNFSVKIHQILISDDACLHDHPWPFVTMLLKGSYTEETFNGPSIFNIKHQTLYSPFSILYRPSNHFHRLIVDKPMWTLFITFKRLKSWGFMVNNKVVEWNEYSHDNQCD